MLLYALVLASAFLYFYNLGTFQVWQPNEAFYADASRNMVATGNYLTPYYNGELRFEKPPLTYWIVSLGYFLFGVNELGLRFFHAVLGLGTGLITSLLAWLLTRNLKTSLLSFLALTLSLQFFANAHYASPEVPLAFFVSATLTSWYAYYKTRRLPLLVLAFLCSSLGMLVKGPVAFVMPAMIVFLFLMFESPREVLDRKYYLLSAVALVLGLWWHAYHLVAYGEEFWKVFFSENLRRVYAGEDPLYFYLLDTLVSFLPYSLIFFPAFVWSVLKARRELKFAILWVLSFFLVFSLIKQKIPLYVMPAYPAMAIITAHFLMSGEWERIKKWNGVFISLAFGVLILATVLYFDLNKAFLLLSVLPIFFLKLDGKYAPAMAIMAFYLFLAGGLLPYLENFRPYRELGNLVKELDPKREYKTYQVGHFHHNLPFYAERKIIKDKTPEKNSLVIFEMGSFEGCEPIKKFYMYKGSESRLFKFLTDAKRNKNFSEFGVCLYF
ncbi:ArnT family glycosyltransferase [Thermocrinis sp.]